MGPRWQFGGSGIEQVHSQVKCNERGDIFVTWGGWTGGPSTVALKMWDSETGWEDIDGSSDMLAIASHFGGSSSSAFASGAALAIDSRGEPVLAWHAWSTDPVETHPDIYLRRHQSANYSPVANARLTPSQLISSNGTNALAALIGAASSDPDGDSLTYKWTVHGSDYFGPVVSVTLELGSHEVLLTVSDGLLESTDTMTVDVVTAQQATVEATQELTVFVDSLVDTVSPVVISQLSESLQQAQNSFEAGNTTAGVNKLGSFQNKVNAALKANKISAAEAAALVQQAQEIIDLQ